MHSQAEPGNEGKTNPATGTTTSGSGLPLPQLNGRLADAGPLTRRKSCPRFQRGEK